VTPCGLIDKCQRFEETSYFENAGSSFFEMLIPAYQTAWSHIKKHLNTFQYSNLLSKYLLSPVLVVARDIEVLLAITAGNAFCCSSQSVWIKAMEMVVISILQSTSKFKAKDINRTQSLEMRHVYTFNGCTRLRDIQHEDIRKKLKIQRVS
jgi:hypothetical protein